ncbi:glycine betaine/L-proline ABC transporter ATP-binding protein, partial [Pseudomonas sp. P7548]|nr:glycine betaine/L-proline ABC transporter ATP-binding protein [Pseudomonas sp. P7548]
FITHDFQEALKLGTRIAIMADGQVVREGTPQEIVADPGSDYVAGFTREVDRSRLFDARSIMQPASTLLVQGDTRVVGNDSANAFVLNAAGKAVGVLDAGALLAVGAGGDALQRLSPQFVSVPASAKLVEVARLLKPGHPVAVADADGVFIGTLNSAHILDCIASVPPPRPAVSEVAHHA